MINLDAMDAAADEPYPRNLAAVWVSDNHVAIRRDDLRSLVRIARAAVTYIKDADTGRIARMELNAILRDAGLID